MTVSPLQTLIASSHSDYEYPKGIIPCKTYDKTVLDCSYRLLNSVPPLSHNLTTALDLSQNSLTEVKGKPFEQLLFLKRLDLGHNEIYNISSDAFTGLRSLENLSLQNNKLMFLPEDIFIDLINLRYLNTSENLFRTVPPTVNWMPLQCLVEISAFSRKGKSLEFSKGFQNLTSLTNLIMYVEELNLNTSITTSTFQHLKSLPIKSVFMSWSPLKNAKIHLEHEIILSLPDLHVLALSYDDLNTFTLVCPHLQRLQIMPPGNNNETLGPSALKKLAQWNSTLTYLKIGLALVEVSDFTFKWTPFLVTLDLGAIELEKLSNNAFVGLDALVILILGPNSLKAVPSHTFHAFQQSESLKKLDLSFNAIGGVGIDAFSCVPSLRNLNLAGNNLVKVDQWLTKLPNLISLDLSEPVVDFYGKIVELDSSPIYTLDLSKTKGVEFLQNDMCSMFPNLIYVWFYNTIIWEFPTSLALHKCIQLMELDLSGSIKSWKFIRKETYLPNLQTLMLIGNELTSIDKFLFIKAKNLTYLDLSENRLQAIKDSDLLSFPSLNFLFLENNSLKSINGLQHLNLLIYLNVAGNQLTVVPNWLFSNTGVMTLTLETLDLSNNPFHCSCNILPFRTWILADTDTRLLGSLYACASPVKLEGQSITAIELDCRSKVGFYVGIIILCSLLAFTSLCLLCKYRWHIKYKLHLIFRHYRHIPDIDEELEMMEENGIPIHYHAYVAYNENSRHDEAWVLDDLQPNLEDGGEQFRLCIKSRDFIPGQPLIETISEKIQQSRKTILVLTRRFVESEWCHHEMQMAQMLLFQQERDVFVLVLLENIPERKITLSLRQLLCKKRYLRWPKDRVGQGLFWQRLREELKTQVHIDRLCDF